MPTPLGSDSHDIRIWDAQETSGSTLANEGTDTGHDFTIGNPGGHGINLGQAGLGIDTYALQVADEGGFTAYCEDGNESGPTLTSYSISALVYPTGIGNGGYTWGPIFCKSYNTGWSPPYEAIGLYWAGAYRTDYSWYACHADSGGTGYSLFSNDWGLNAQQNKWNLLWQTWNGSTLTIGMHYLDGSNAVTFAGSHTLAVASKGMGSGPWFGPGFKNGTGFDRSILGKYARMRVRDQAESASFFATLLTTYRDAGAPTLTSVVPAGGPVGQVFVITGTTFNTGVTVTVGGVAASVTRVDSTTLIVTAPSHANGAVDVVVTNTNGGVGTATNGFTYITYTTNERKSEILG